MSDLEFDDLYGSKYFCAADLKGGTVRLKIGKVETVELREKTGGTKRRWILWFEGQEKALVLNKTNAIALATVFGKNPENLIGQMVELFAAMTSFGEGVRLRPLRKPATVAAPDPDLKDAVPF
jgi:hypothetical protein